MAETGTVKASYTTLGVENMPSCRKRFESMPQQSSDRLWMILMNSDQVPWTLKHHEFYIWSTVAALILVGLSAWVLWLRCRRNSSGLLRYWVSLLLTIGSFVVITIAAILVWFLPNSLLGYFGIQHIAQLHPDGVSYLIDLLYFGQYLVVWNLVLALGFMLSMLLLPYQDQMLASMRREQANAAEEEALESNGNSHESTNQSKNGNTQLLVRKDKSGVDKK